MRYIAEIILWIFGGACVASYLVVVIMFANEGKPTVALIYIILFFLACLSFLKLRRNDHE